MTRSESGVTLIEMVIATALGAVAVLGVLDLVGTLMRTQAAGQGALTAQAGAMGVVKIAERELSQTTVLTRPASAGIASALLEGCVNADASGAALDPSRPVRGWALCQDAGAVFYHGGSCPPVYSCGSGGILVAGSQGGQAAAAMTFRRPSAGSALVEGDVTVVAAGNTMTLHAASQAAFAPEAP